MACYSSFTLSLLFTILLFSSLASANIEKACKEANRSTKAVDYNFCVGSLRTDPKSEFADAKGLALISTQLCLKNATATLSKITNLIAKGNFSLPIIKEILPFCVTSFTELIKYATGAVHAIKLGNYTDALLNVEDIYSQADDCSLNFVEGPGASSDPVYGDEMNLNGLANLALFLIGRVK